MQHLYSHRNSALFSYFPSFRTNTLYISRIFTTYTLYIFNVLACIPIIRLLFRPQPLCCLAISMTCGIFSPNALFLVNCPIIWSLLYCVCVCGCGELFMRSVQRFSGKLLPFYNCYRSLYHTKTNARRSSGKLDNTRSLTIRY